MPWTSYGSAGGTYGDVTSGYGGGPDPWVLLTGPKGPIGSQLPVAAGAGVTYAGMARSWDYQGYSGNHGRILVINHQQQGSALVNSQGGGSYGIGPIILRDTGTPVWTQAAARAADSGVGQVNITHANPTGTTRSMPPGWSAFVFPTVNNTAPQNWVATDGTNTAWRTTVATGPIAVYSTVAINSGTFLAGTVLALYVNGVEVARTIVTRATNSLSVRTERSFAINDVLSLQFYNPDTVNPVVLVDTIQAGPGTRRPYLNTSYRLAENLGDYWVCPTAGNYDIHAEVCGGSYCIAYNILVNHQPRVSCTVPYAGGTDDYTIQAMDLTNVALNVGDVVAIGALMSDYSQGWLSRIDGAEGTAEPYLRITNRAPTVPVSSPMQVVRRYCTGTLMTSDNGGFAFYSATWSNYANGYMPMQIYRDAQGKVVMQGLFKGGNDIDYGNTVLSLPWDMLPMSGRMCVFWMSNNAQNRADILVGGGSVGTWPLSRVSGTWSSAWTQVNATWYTYMPQCWVDFGCKTTHVAPGSYYEYTVMPGQVSGWIKGVPVTMTVPAATVRFGYASSYYSNYMWVLVFDMNIGDFDQVLVPLTGAGGAGQYWNPWWWLNLATQGKVVLYCATLTTYPDHRFLIRGPLG